MLRDILHSPFADLPVSFNGDVADFARHPWSLAQPTHAAAFADRPAPIPAGQSVALTQHTITTAAGSSPSMADEVSFLNGVDETGAVVGTSFWTWRNNTPATYKTISDAGKWGADHVTTTDVPVVHYFFQTTSTFTAEEKAVFQSCMALWSAVTNVDFEETTRSTNADLVLKRGTDNSAYEFDSDSNSGGAGTIGDTTLFQRTHATVSIDTSVDGFGPIDGSFTEFGGYVWGTIIHELGHALGLGHAGPYNGTVHPSTQQFSAYDSLVWTIMSYIEPHEVPKFADPVAADWGRSPDGYHNTPTTVMPLDIVAIQGLYGAPISTPLSGGQVFGFHTNITGAIKDFFDFTVNVNPVVTIFDTGTGNTLDLSGFDAASTVDLNPGTFSSADGMTNNIAIAFDTSVDTAIGGKGDDSLTANDDGDRLIGAKGLDKLIGGTANDFLNGGGGRDTITGGAGADILRPGGGRDTLVYSAVADSTSTHFDTVVGFDFAADRFHFPASVAAVDDTVAAGLLTNAGFDTELAVDIGPSQLAAGHAVLFTPTVGDFDGDTFLVVDANGTAGYQGGEDYVLLLSAAKHIDDIDGATFT